MPAIHWKLEVNTLTVPQSYKMRFVPNNNLGTDDIAAGMTEINPALTPELARASITALMQTLQKELLNGNHITLDDSLIFTISLTGRLDDQDDQPPPVADCVNVRINPTAKFMKTIHNLGALENEGMSEKLPLIMQAEDTSLRLNDVLRSTAVLQLSGERLAFDPQQGNGQCVIKGTRSGSVVQTQFGPISNTSIILIPTIPAQDNPWNNEYMVSVAVRYTAHGTLRTGTYRRRLRSPLTVPLFGHPHPPETGILSGSGAAALVSVTDGTASADAMLRIQAVLDMRQDLLLFSLMDMKEGGTVGAAVSVTANGEITLQGFSGSAVTNLKIRVNDFAALKELIRNDYGGRLADVLEVKTA
jgi:hypothetical protein